MHLLHLKTNPHSTYQFCISSATHVYIHNSSKESLIWSLFIRFGFYTTDGYSTIGDLLLDGNLSFFSHLQSKYGLHILTEVEKNILAICKSGCWFKKKTITHA